MIGASQCSGGQQGPVCVCVLQCATVRKHMFAHVSSVNTYYPLLPLLFPQPDELLVLPGDKVDCGVLQQGGKHKQETHGHPNVNGFHIRHLGRDMSQSVAGYVTRCGSFMVFPSPVQFLWHTLTHISGNTSMTCDESVVCEWMTHSHGTGHKWVLLLVREVMSNCVGIFANEPRSVNKRQRFEQRTHHVIYLSCNHPDLP